METGRCARLERKVREDPCPSGEPPYLHLSTYPEANPDKSEVKRRCAVYQTPCNNCNHMCTGELKRAVKICMADHRRVTPTMALRSTYIAKSHHSIDWKEAIVVKPVQENWE